MEYKSARPSGQDLKRFKEITDQVNRLSIEVAQIVERTLKLPETSPILPVSKFTFTPKKGPDDSLNSMIEIVRIDGDIIWVGCMQDPPGVSCMGPCPCE